MSFGQKLANKAQAIRKRHCEQWMEETLNDFMEECEGAAEDGDYGHEMLMDVPDRARDEALVLLNQKLAELGFTRAGAELAAVCMKGKIWATWDMPAKVPGKSKATPQGIWGKCPISICQETRHLVVLMPCGHTLCKQCHASSQLRQCHVRG